MKDKLLILPICLIAMALLAGCGESGSSFLGFGDGSAGDGSIVTAALSGGSSSGDEGSNGNGSGNSGNGGGVTHPEPTTMALLGSGLLAYALFRRKRKK